MAGYGRFNEKEMVCFSEAWNHWAGGRQWDGPEVLRAHLRFVVVHLKIVVVSSIVSDAPFV